MEKSCCSLARKMGGTRCPICRQHIRQAKVLRLLRHDARMWWWHQQLRKQGNIAEAVKLERASIRREVQFIRANIGRHAVTHRASVIEFPNREPRRPFDLSIVHPWGGREFTSYVSGCHAGSFAAWVWCYAHRIGLKYTAKQYDTV